MFLDRKPGTKRRRQAAVRVAGRDNSVHTCLERVIAKKGGEKINCKDIREGRGDNKAAEWCTGEEKTHNYDSRARAGLDNYRPSPAEYIPDRCAGWACCTLRQSSIINTMPLCLQGR
ncbi:hypothetical protein PoB_007342400 [Plakobranchus ocellatus]|uniref:Uncharacterized protein n=1 Tax=Plakobranchus ocellatus TaxID=259542 RepID=A0AAV4DSF2_9GAST|nr:hypothetical protein PoB_007342400 [Plakobranchus ocellatus]